ncbi:MAG: hypothetical protein M0Z94_15145 [Dehalococcoidales bacterium]|nr:hypothetical protein [Dehalococcoidales bacterium]
MKPLLMLIALALFGLTFWAYRSRLRFAFRVATIGYLVILASNIVRAAGNEDNIPTLTFALIGMGGAWLIIWIAVTLIERRKTGN